MSTKTPHARDGLAIKDDREFLLWLADVDIESLLIETGDLEALWSRLGSLFRNFTFAEIFGDGDLSHEELL